jgi:hypothetical protein
MAQTFQQEMGVLNSSDMQWREINTPDLIKKMPYNLANATSEQITNSEVPNSTEVKQLDMAITHREAFVQQLYQIMRKYIRPSSAADELIRVSLLLARETNKNMLKLRDGEITFGQYLVARQHLEVQHKKNITEILDKYHLDFYGQPIGVTQPQQR